MANKFVAMTRAARRRHLRTGGEVECPYCRGRVESDPDLLDYGDGPEPVDGGNLESKVRCTACGREWVDVFVLADVREVFTTTPGGGLDAQGNR